MTSQEILAAFSFHFKLYFSPSLPAWKFFECIPNILNFMLLSTRFLKISLNTLRLCSVVQLLETVSSF